MENYFRAYSGNKPYIFVSYSHADSQRVYPILKELNSEGYRIWYDEGIMPTEEWRGVINDHVRDCGMFMIFVTRNSMASYEVIKECTYAINLHKKLHIVYLEDVPASQIDSSLSADFTNNQCVLAYKLHSSIFAQKLRAPLADFRDAVQQPVQAAPKPVQTVQQPAPTAPKPAPKTSAVNSVDAANSEAIAVAWSQVRKFPKAVEWIMIALLMIASVLSGAITVDEIVMYSYGMVDISEIGFNVWITYMMMYLSYPICGVVCSVICAWKAGTHKGEMDSEKLRTLRSTAMWLNILFIPALYYGVTLATFGIVPRAAEIGSAVLFSVVCALLVRKRSSVWMIDSDKGEKAAVALRMVILFEILLVVVSVIASALIMINYISLGYYFDLTGYLLPLFTFLPLCYREYLLLAHRAKLKKLSVQDK